MININDFVKELTKNGLTFSAGVPDSLFKNLCFSFEYSFKKNHLVSANEGSAIGLGIGYHLSTKKIPIIYMQNSGLGNSINPLISLADNKVYSIPLFLIIGWRGEKNKRFIDEPQHRTQGKVTQQFLKNLGIKYKVLNSSSKYKKDIKFLKNYAKKNKKPVALLIKKNTFEDIKSKKAKKKIYPLREKLLKIILKKLPNRSNIVSTTGIISREIYENKTTKSNINHFMCVGGMGHAISVAQGIAKTSKKKIFCFDGDGALTMHMGSLSTSKNLNNLVHIVFNNFSHESVGGHDNAAKHVKFYELAKILGYKNSVVCKNEKEVLLSLKKSLKSNRNYFIEILCAKGHRKNISRPKENMIYLKNIFMKKFK